jgi:hypothetical protein
LRSGKIGCYSHVIEIGNLALLVANDREAQLAAANLVDVLDPSSVRFNSVGRETDQLDTTLGELGLKLCEGAELGGADGRVVFGVGEQDNPVVADELVEVNRALGGLGLEVGCNGSQAEARGEGLARKDLDGAKICNSNAPGVDHRSRQRVLRRTLAVLAVLTVQRSQR